MVSIKPTWKERNMLCSCRNEPENKQKKFAKKATSSKKSKSPKYAFILNKELRQCDSDCIRIQHIRLC